MTKLTTQTTPDVDVIIQGHGSIILVWPQNRSASIWLEDNLDIQQRWGNGIAVEPRYISAIIEGLEAVGYKIG